ncbi:MAG: 16S rRNA (cytidine(1402)-2'-O)-methyltransferase [Akkermansiaceae bacterium]|nr:16S rRNA (cytidine(1402)-2'-O)-methyltransferase [Akkermansiaceae bacterium]
MIAYPVSFVPLPIGNREDITQRALRVLSEADCICCEDTRHTGMLLAHYGIHKPLLSMHEHNERQRAPEIARRAQEGELFAVVTDAGMPGVSDPGYRLIQELKAQGVAFTVLPGPSAVVTALVGSGLPSDAFYFGGFLPTKSGKRRQALAAAAAAPHTSIFYESPFRIGKTLRELAELAPDAPVCVAREISKLHETYHRSTAAELAAAFESAPPKGEMVLLIGGTNA